MVGKTEKKKKNRNCIDGKATRKLPPQFQDSSWSMSELMEKKKSDVEEDSSNAHYIERGIVIPRQRVVLFVLFGFR